MSARLTPLRHYRWLASLAVLAFALRALIPAGFMPGGNGPLALQVCPDGFPAALLATSGDPHAAHHHHHATTDAPAATASAEAGTSPDGPVHDHQSWSAGHCVFSAVAAAPPISHTPVIAVAVEVAVAPIPTDTARVPLDIRFRIAQPRAPPHLA